MYKKNPLVFSLENIPHFKFLPNDVSAMSIFNNVLLLRPCMHIVCIANITKPIIILYQISKLFLNFGYAILYAMTPPHLLYVKHNSFIKLLMVLLCKNCIIFLFFPGPPRADVASIQEKLHLGQNLKLTCPIQGDPTPLFEWFKVSHTHHGSLFYLLLCVLTDN